MYNILDSISFRLLVESIADYSIYMLDPVGVVKSWNLGAERVKGYSAQEIIGKHFSCFYGLDEQLAFRPQQNLDAARQNGRYEEEGWRYRKDGSRFWAHVVVEGIFVEERCLGFAKVTRDCSRQRERSIAHQLKESDLSVALSFLPHGACVLDDQTRIVFSNQAFEEIFSKFPQTSSELTSFTDLLFRISILGCAGMIDDVSMFFGRRDQQVGVFELETSCMVLALKIRRTESVGWVVAVEDITQRRTAEAVAFEQTRHDHLTGLYNREALGEHLRDILDSPVASARISVLYLDLDRFKAINDTLGHAAGDIVLREVGRRLSRLLRQEDFACRLGGDEFMIVPAGSLSGRQVRRVAQRISLHLSEPFFVEGKTVDVGASIGIAASPVSGTTAQRLISDADVALFKAKRDGGNRWCHFDNNMGLLIQKRRTMERQLREALPANEFFIEYQPICSAETRDIRGFEASRRFCDGGNQLEQWFRQSILFHWLRN